VRLLASYNRKNRGQRKHTRKSIAKALGVSERTSQRWFDGKSAPDFYQVRELAELLDVGVAVMYGIGESDKHGAPSPPQNFISIKALPALHSAARRLLEEIEHSQPKRSRSVTKSGRVAPPQRGA